MKSPMKSVHTKLLYSLLASTALLTMPAMQSAAQAASLERTIVVAQSTAAPSVDKKADKRADKDTRANPKANVKVERAKPGADMKKVRQSGNDKNHADDNRSQKRDMTHDQMAPATVAPKASTAERKSPAATPHPVAEKAVDKMTAPSAQVPATPEKQAAPAPSPTRPKATQAAPAPAGAQADSSAAVAAPKARDSSEFILRAGQQPPRSMADVRKNRHETKDGNRVVIQEDNRTIERDGNRTIIRHNEADRFAVGARNVKVDHRGNETISIILRPNGISIISTTDERGHLLRRVRRDRNGHEMVIIDNGTAGARHGDYFVDVRPPRVRGHNDRYIVDARRARPDLIYQLLLAPPVDALDRHYTVDQVRYSYPLREYMPRVDLGIDFDTGSWQLSPDQVGELSVIANGINRAIDKNPREVFLIEGHTDAVGDKEDNLSLSDRRAEAVAIALTEQFQVPPENLLTQGYGEENLKVATDGPSRENRYVAVRRITPLIAQAGTQGSGSNL
jgi:OOP family OmpA-OmpF porin